MTSQEHEALRFETIERYRELIGRYERAGEFQKANRARIDMHKELRSIKEGQCTTER